MKKISELLRTLIFSSLMLIVLSVLLGCPNTAVKDGKAEQIVITVKGDENAETGKNPSFTVNKGVKWETVKTNTIIKSVTFKAGYELSEWKLNNAAGITLTDGYSFNSDAAVFAVSKKKGSAGKITITVQGDEYVETGKGSSFTVDKGTNWGTVKTHASIKGVTFKAGYELSEWKLNNAVGLTLPYDYAFHSDTAVFAVSKKKPSEKVTITVHGDENVLSGKGTSFNVDKGSKWSAVKMRPEITGITFKDGFEFSAWKLGNSAGNDLNDNYAFNDNTTVFALSKGKKIEKVKITVQGDSHVTSGKGGSFNVNKGTKWAAVRENTAIKGITFESGFELLQWKLNNAGGDVLTDSYAFSTDITVFAVSKIKPVEKITITVQGDNNVINGKGVSFSVDKGSKWSAVRTKTEITGITFKTGFELSEWKLNNAAGETLTDNYAFKADSTVFAFSRKDNTVQKVTVTVQGDDNMLTGKGSSFTVDKGTKWETVKTNSAVTDITFKEKHSLDIWRIDSVNGEILKDEYAFNEDKTVFAVSTLYVKVKYSELDNYLNVNASGSEDNYIEITDIAAENLKGKYGKSSALGSVLNKYSSKSTALKLPETVAELTDMSFCFYNCASLKSLAFFPKGVTKVTACFNGCENLAETPKIPDGVESLYKFLEGCENITSAAVIPDSVTDMSNCFKDCTNLRLLLLFLKMLSL